MKSFIKIYLFPLLLGTVLFSLFFYYANLDLKRTCGEAERKIENSTKLVTSVLVGNIQHLIRCEHGCVSTRQLDGLVSVLMATTELEYFRIEQKGRILFSIPENSFKEHVFDGETGTRVNSGVLYHWRTLRLALPSKEQSTHAHLENEDDILLMSGTHIKLIVGYPFQDCLTTHQLSKKKFVTRIGAAGALVVIFLFSIVYAVRNQKLKREVAVLQQKNEHLEVLNLAASGLAHETKNPLGIIRGLAQRLSLSTAVEDNVKECAEAIMEQADVTVDRLGDFMNYARISKPLLHEVNLCDVCADIITVFKYDCEDQGITLSIDLDELTVFADHKALEHIVSNLLLNSVKACGAGDSIQIRSVREGGMCGIVIADSGKGICESLLPDIFKPYVSGGGNGHGIGLSIVKRCVEESGWNIEVSSIEGQGTSMKITGIQEV